MRGESKQHKRLAEGSVRDLNALPELETKQHQKPCSLNHEIIITRIQYPGYLHLSLGVNHTEVLILCTKHNLANQNSSTACRLLKNLLTVPGRCCETRMAG